MKRTELRQLNKQVESWEKKLLEIKKLYSENVKIQKEVEILLVQKDEIKTLLNSSVWEGDGLEEIDDAVSHFKKSFEKLIHRIKGKKSGQRKMPD